MIDNCIKSLSDTMQCTLKEVEIKVGNTLQGFKVLGFERKPVPKDNEKWKRNQFNCLPTIARLARQGIIDCYTYSELRHEAWKKPGSFPANVIGRLFSDVSFIDVDAAVERSYFFQMDFSKYKDQMAHFCKWLVNSNFTGRIDSLASTDRYPTFLLNNLRNVERYKNLCNGLSEGQYPDAFHLWTAEVNDVKYFLTTDRKFIRVMAETKNIDLPCIPICPEELLKELHVNDYDSFPHPENNTIDIFGNPL